LVAFAELVKLHLKDVALA